VNIWTFEGLSLNALSSVSCEFLFVVCTSIAACFIIYVLTSLVAWFKY